MTTALDKRLEEKRKKRDGEFEHQFQNKINWWKLFFISPKTWGVFIIICIICYGTFHAWEWKVMIGEAFSYILTAVITGLIQHFLTHKKK